MKGLQNWFNQLQRHEQILAMIAAALVSTYLLYLLVWSPIASQREQLELQNAAVRQSLDNVRQLAAQYLALNQGGSSGAATTGNLSRVVDSSVAQHGLSMRRYQPSASGDAQVRFENVPFNNMLRWLNELESSQGILVRDLSITPGNGSGLVNVSVRLQQP